LVGADPRIEIAILKIPVEDVPYFSLDQAQPLDVGDRVLAFSNLFGVAMGDEPASVQHGNVSIKTSLSARRGAFETPYDGPVYVLDAMTNNPGAAGGVLTNLRGELAGILGKELRNTLNNTWLNHAVPIDAITASVEGILAGKILPRTVEDETRKPAQPWTLSLLGVRLVPERAAQDAAVPRCRDDRFARGQSRFAARRLDPVHQRSRRVVVQEPGGRVDVHRPDRPGVADGPARHRPAGNHPGTRTLDRLRRAVSRSNFMFAADGLGPQKRRWFAANMKFEGLTPAYKTAFRSPPENATWKPNPRSLFFLPRLPC
jgi:S1-C subfamily serine protease